MLREKDQIKVDLREIRQWLNIGPTTEHSWIHSFRSLSYDRSVASSKESSPQNAIWCLLFQFY
jgi:hypothetical protein